MKDFFEDKIARKNIIYAVKGGIPHVGHSANPDFYLLCYDFVSNIGYIEKKRENSWRLYTRTESLLKLYWNGKTEKFYYNDDSFKKCTNKLEELTGRRIKVLNRKEVEKLKRIDRRHSFIYNIQLLLKRLLRFSK